MKISTMLLCCAVLLMTTSSLQAGEAILYAGTQKPGKISFTSEDVDLAGGILEGGYGGTYGIRFSGGKKLGLEENISYSPRFGRSGVHAFQMDTNIVLQAPGRIAPYATIGLGFIVTWGQDYPTDDPTPAKVANYAFSLGKEFSYNYGGGIKVRRILGSMGLNFDIRSYTIPDARDDSLSFVQTSLGAVFNW
jgi:hypothetical protein